MGSIRSASVGGNADSTSGNVNKPTGAVNGDRIIAIAFSDDVSSSALSPTNTTGWTQRHQTIGTGTANGGGANRTVRVWERTHSGDGSTYAWSRAGGSGSWMVWTWAIQDLDPTSAIVCSGAGTATGKVLTAPGIPGADYVGDDPIVLFAGAAIVDNGSTAITYSTPAGMTWSSKFQSDAYLQGISATSVESGHPDISPRTTTATIATYTNIPWLAVEIVIPNTFASPKRGLFLPF